MLRPQLSQEIDLPIIRSNSNLEIESAGILQTEDAYISPEQAREQALAYVRQVEASPNIFDKFRTYRLVNSAEEAWLKGHTIHSPSTPRLTKKKIVLTLGCQGSAAKEQADVAKHLEKVVKDLSEKGFEIAAILILGDNVYDDGANSPDDPKIKKCCEDQYANLKNTPTLAHIPFFYIQGNHDKKLHNKRIPFTAHGDEIGNMQIAHTFMPDHKYPTVEGKIKAYNRKNPKDLNEYLLNTDHLSHFNMPGRAYSLIIDNVADETKKNEGMEIFCIDSSNIVAEYLEGKPNNQIDWLRLKLKEARDKNLKTVLALHHPFVSLGKRFKKDDSHLYMNTDTMSKESLAQARSRLHLPETATYNEILRAIFDIEKLSFDTVLAAHDHCIYHHKEKGLSQIVAGGGGSEGIRTATNRHDFTREATVFFDDYGFVALEADKEKINYAFYSLDPILADCPLLFNSKDDTPMRGPEFQERIDKYALNPQLLRSHTKPSSAEEYEKVKQLGALAKKGIQHFFHFIANHQGIKFFSPLKNLTHSYQEVKRAHRLQTYLNHSHISSYDRTLEIIRELSGSDIYTTENSLFEHIRQVVNKTLHINTTPIIRKSSY